jgi:hypothetical protein
MIDADGHIGLYWHGGKGRDRPRLTVGVSNTDRDLLLWIQEITGVGSVCIQRHATETTKANYNWSTLSESAASLLRQTLPFMLVKGERAKLGLEYHATLDTLAGRLDVEQQNRYFEEMRALTKRGPKNERPWSAPVR